MARLIHLAACAFACAIAAAPAAADRTGNSCLAKTRGPYGFHCHGSTLVGNPQAGFQFGPVTVVGTVEGDGTGIFEGTNTFTSWLGSVPTHFKGHATFDKNCFGRVEYTTNEIVLPDGSTIPLPPAAFDAATVDGGQEILGAGVAPPGVTGDQVPRLFCRLVRIRGD
jgi:hypothetical protein